MALNFEQLQPEQLDKLKTMVTSFIQQTYPELPDASALVQYLLHILNSDRYMTSQLNKNGITKESLTLSIQDVFKDNTEKIVNFVFTILAPQIKEASKSSGALADFEDDAQDVAAKSKPDTKQQKPAATKDLTPPKRQIKSVAVKPRQPIKQEASGVQGTALLKKAINESASSTQAPTKVITIPGKETHKEEKKDDIFSRLKKRNPEDNLEERRIRGDHFSQNKRIKREPYRPLQINMEDKVIDLAKNKNNVREQEDGEPKKAKCKHYPNCKDGDNCKFYHPTEECPYFPKCNFGQQCRFIHPDIECKFAFNCTRKNCSYKHPKGHQPGGGNMAAAMMMASLFNPKMAGKMMGGGAAKPKNKTYVANKGETAETKQAEPAETKAPEEITGQ